MSKRGHKGRIEVWCFRCRWNGGRFLQMQDALDAMGRHGDTETHRLAVEQLRKAA